MRLTKKELRYIVIHRSAATSSVAVSDKPAPVAIVMLNMGGPSSLDGPVDGVEPFLRRLFLDGEIIKLGPLQSVLVCEADYPMSLCAPRYIIARSTRTHNALKFGDYCARSIPLLLVAFLFRTQRVRQGPYIARKRAPRIKKQYDEIGGRSPIGQWTDLQGREMTRKLEVRLTLGSPVEFRIVGADSFNVRST